MKRKILILISVLFIVSIEYSKEKCEKIKTEVLQPVKAISGKADPRLYVRDYSLMTIDEKMNIYVTDN